MTENTAEKRSVHTDALETLGSIIGEHEKRDAIHIAVEPAVAAARLKPGQDVGFVDGGFATTKNNVGIVDPFLKHDVREGEHFWLLIYPRQITSLRHVWSHPDFPEAEYASEDVKADDPAIVSRKWIEQFAAQVGLKYQILMDGAKDYYEGKKAGGWENIYASADCLKVSRFLMISGRTTKLSPEKRSKRGFVGRFSRALADSKV